MSLYTQCNTDQFVQCFPEFEIAVCLGACAEGLIV